MYSLDEFGEMLGDPLRFSAYCEAIAGAVKPGDVVVDIGSGPGVFALLACKAGARKAYAIDTESVVDFARQFASDNGYADRIECLRGDSRHILLPERANVIISDIRGALPLFGQGIHALNDARKRMLAENGRMIPAQDKLFAALVELPETYERILAPWRNVSGLDLHAVLPVVLNAMYKRECKPDKLISEKQEWHTLDYLTGANPKAGAALRFTAKRQGTTHGFILWFEAKLHEKIGFSTEPGTADCVYGQVFLPLLEPVKLAAGEEICAALHADLIGTDYVWRWEFKADRTENHGPVDHRQSTFQGGGITPTSLRKRSGEFVPVLSEAGLAERWLLMAMDGKAPLEQIAVKASEQFPRTFARPEDAFRRAGELSDRYSR